jgi:integrating conjugative element membrane protein (TIGR03747 family)
MPDPVYRSKKSHSTIWSIGIHFLMMIFILNIVAWLFLLLWFSPLLIKNNVMGLIKDITIIIVKRLLQFIHALPLLLSMLFIAIVDGLGQRDIRKFQGARESAFFFHRIKPLCSKLFYLLFLIYLGMPWSFNPLALLVPMICLISITTQLTIKNYKKYL